MLPSELKLASLGHCYIELPQPFIAKKPSLKPGSVVSIRSVQSDIELLITWNGQLTSGNYARLDLVFAQANKLKDELIVIDTTDDLSPENCSLCRVELVEPSDYEILSQHLDANVLDTCRLVSRGLILPIWVTKHVKVLVKVIEIKPNGEYGFLTQRTEMQYQHTLDKISDEQDSKEDQAFDVKNPIELVSYSLGVGHDVKLSLGGLLVCGERGSGKTHFLRSLIDDYKQFHSEIYNCKQFRGKRPETIKKILNELLIKALENQPSILCLDDIDSIVPSENRQHQEDKGQEAIYQSRVADIFRNIFKQVERGNHAKGNRVIIIASSRSIESIDERISKPLGRKYFQQVHKLAFPNSHERASILKEILSQYRQVKVDVSDEEITIVADRCSSYMPVDIKRLLERAIITACSRALHQFNSDPINLSYHDLIESIEGYQPINLRGVSLHQKTKRTMDQVGGMKSIKQDLLKMVTLQIKYPKLMKKCAIRPQNSVLLYGPPGCGKTLVAEAITNLEFINSICVRGPELLSKYIGASEAAVRDVFRRAELARPCVIFFDEFESLVSKRGADSTGVTDRIVNQFLTVMDGVETLSSDIFIVAASSRPDMIDPAILRPGRLDRHIYCPIPDVEDRTDILRVLSQNMTIDNREDFLRKWPALLEGYTGADIQAFLYSAQLKALHDTLESSHETDAESNDKSSLKGRQIEVKDRHFEMTSEEMLEGIQKRFVNLLKAYPAVIRGKEPVVASRATLA